MKKLPILRNAKQIISINELKKKFIILFSILIIFQIQAYPISGKYLKTSYEYPNVILSKKSLKNLESVSSALYQLSITGIVKDSDGTPLPGASVLEKGTTNGVITDFDGNFKIDIKNANAILIVSYLGFQQREVSAAGQTNISIMLDEDSSKLDEVIVTGYTSERKSDLTGAVSIIQLDETTNQPLASVNELVQGRSAGVDVLRSNAPGGNAAIRIRGFSTIRNNDPLYVVDGVPTTTGINLINPNDIESLQVLKDASSASIYGSRAANGVVVITTKKW
jgi:TonB-dependent SusC/RagA subfamily outer membrane receptor